MSSVRRVHYLVVLFLLLFGLATSAQAKKTKRLSSPNAAVQVPADAKSRRITVKMPQTYGEILGSGNRYRQGIGYACEAGEAVRTCDANVSAVMPKGDLFGGSNLVLGSASNPALLGIRVKTQCTARVEYDSSSLSGCVYEGCFGYIKPITMVCVTKGSN